MVRSFRKICGILRQQQPFNPRNHCCISFVENSILENRVQSDFWAKPILSKAFKRCVAAGCSFATIEPASGVVRVKGVETCPNTVLHAWLKQQLSDIIQSLPQSATVLSIQDNHTLWSSWRQGLKVKFTLREELPPLRMLLVCDNLVGHKTPDFVVWLCHQGILPLYTPECGSW